MKIKTILIIAGLLLGSYLVNLISENYIEHQKRAYEVELGKMLNRQESRRFFREKIKSSMGLYFVRTNSKVLGYEIIDFGVCEGSANGRKEWICNGIKVKTGDGFLHLNAKCDLNIMRNGDFITGRCKIYEDGGLK